MVEVLVRAEGVSRTFGDGATRTMGLRSASCVLCRGEVIALVGPSGGGKSTLLHLLAGIDEPTAGELSWPGLPANRAAAGGIAVVFQAPSLIPALTVVENVAFPLLLQGCAEDEALVRAQDTLARFGIAQIAEELPEEISGGQAQRASICRAVAARPALLLADEPTGQLDSATAASVLTTLLDALDEMGAAAIIATHDLAVAGQLPMMWRMNHGVLEAPAPCAT